MVSAIMMVGSEEKLLKSRSTFQTSSKRVTAQKPRPSGSSCQWTGSSSRSQRYCSWGWPSEKLANDSKSICMGLAPPRPMLQARRRPPPLSRRVKAGRAGGGRRARPQPSGLGGRGHLIEEASHRDEAAVAHRHEIGALDRCVGADRAEAPREAQVALERVRLADQRE